MLQINRSKYEAYIEEMYRYININEYITYISVFNIYIYIKYIYM